MSAARAHAQLASLEAGRGIAALLVVAVHTWDHCAQAYGPFALGRLFTFGHAGVDFFFVLSGFIILHVHGGDIGQPRRLSRYAERRISRIYPLYWIGIALVLASFALAGHPLPGWGGIATSVLLLPTVDPPVLGVAWTLQQEMVFYTVFALLIVHRRLGQAAFALWLALLLAGAAAPEGTALAAPGAWLAGNPAAGLADKLASFFDVEFFLGMAVAWLCRRPGVAVARPRLILLAGVTGFAAIGLAEDFGQVVGPANLTHLGYGLAAAAVVLGLVGAEQAGVLAVPRGLRVLGGASYSIYLTHLLSVGAAWQVLLASGLAAALPGWGAFLVLLAAALGVGVAVSTVVERPLIRWIRQAPSKTPALKSTS